MNRLLFLFCLFLAATSAAEEPNLVPPGSARAQLDRFSTGLETLHARFEQQVIGSDGAVQDGSSGDVWLRRPQQFRWAYGGDFPELIVADGTTVWIYDQTLEQVTVREQSAAAADSPLMLLTDTGRLDEQFEVREAGDAFELQLLELRARSADTDFERVLLGLRDDTLMLMILEDAFGLRTEIRFHDVQRNPVLDASLFSFEPPGGVDVIGDVK